MGKGGGCGGEGANVFEFIRSLVFLQPPNILSQIVGAALKHAERR